MGGLGGIGRAILIWMAKKGARHLLVLSRSGTESGEAAAQVVTHLRGKCVCIDVPRCNVANADELAEALRDYEVRNPSAPIRGCINSAMVLQVGLIQPQALDCYERTLNDSAGFCAREYDSRAMVARGTIESQR